MTPPGNTLDDIQAQLKTESARRTMADVMHGMQVQPLTGTPSQSLTGYLLLIATGLKRLPG